ncbi:MULTISPECIES: hypothetical protein [Streptomyces]|uniref:Uncharacterized protein n=1 Tax=Streptomyces doebereineriae TaxID=3075528 RepID=A0ABU2VGB3_9ACTN|nr:hypothetical protein [Streptomyces sp. DSM 41640]MDT0484609.1 hypothetical protein [Streptomyces sp. DSM 41640]
MEVTGVGIAAFVAFVLAPGLSSVLKSVAFRIRASGKAELLRAGGESTRQLSDGRRAGKRGRRG